MQQYIFIMFNTNFLKQIHQGCKNLIESNIVYYLFLFILHRLSDSNEPLGLDLQELFFMESDFSCSVWICVTFLFHFDFQICVS